MMDNTAPRDDPRGIAQVGTGFARELRQLRGSLDGLASERVLDALDAAQRLMQRCQAAAHSLDWTEVVDFVQDNSECWTAAQARSVF